MMDFDLMGLIFMVIAIWVGNLLGPMLGGFVGFGGGLIGAFISGLIIYYIYSMISGSTISMMGGVVFAVCVYASVIVTGFVTGYVGFLSGIFAVFIQAIFLSIIYSAIAPKTGAPQLQKAPVKT